MQSISSSDFVPFGTEFMAFVNYRRIALSWSMLSNVFCSHIVSLLSEFIIYASSNKLAMAITINIFHFQQEFALLLCRKGTTNLFDTYTLVSK